MLNQVVEGGTGDALPHLDVTRAKLSDGVPVYETEIGGDQDQRMGEHQQKADNPRLAVELKHKI